MKIDNAIGSLNVNNLRMRFLEMKTATERLSSGLKINRAADDPSGLAIRDGMNAKARSLSTAIANVEESIRMTRIMDSSMATIGDILVQLKSLAVRASNEAVLRDDCSDRTKLNSEARALVKEIDQIAYSTLYNAKKYFRETLSRISSQTGRRCRLSSPPGRRTAQVGRQTIRFFT